MSYVTGDFPVMAGGLNVGSVTIEQNGLMLMFDCSCDYKSRDVLRLAAVCDGKYVPLGVMVPDTAAHTDARTSFLHLKKSFTKNALMSIGYSEAVTFHLIKPGEVYSKDEAAEEAYKTAVQQKKPEVDLPLCETEPIVYVDFPDPAEYEYAPATDDLEAESDVNAELPEPAGQVCDSKSEPAANANPPKLEIPEPEPARKDHKPKSQVPDHVPAIASGKSDIVDGWKSISNPSNLFNDPNIQESCTAVSNALITERDGCVLLAVPVKPTEPFPMMPVFCFGSSKAIGGQECIIFKIKNGHLSL